MSLLPVVGDAFRFHRSNWECSLISDSKQNSVLDHHGLTRLDVCVFFSCVGSGATGYYVALDAATRGLRVGLVERDNYSAGTSSRSTKLVHEACPWHVPGFILSFEFCIPKSKHHAKVMKQVEKKSLNQAVDTDMPQE